MTPTSQSSLDIDSHSGGVCCITVVALMVVLLAVAGYAVAMVVR